ncbi:MAG: MFS transporter [Rhizorhabdus sp.]
MQYQDPRETIARSPMTARQIIAIGLAILLNALDGFDVLSISFAAPGISKEWGIDRAALGIVLSMELIGMAVGSVALGQLCDRIGRRPTVLLCVVIMAVGMALAALAQDIMSLSLCRLFTGLGIGGMLAATAAVVAEFASAKRRNLAVAIMAGGYPLGAVLGGSAAAWLLASYDWRAVFVFGALISAACIPLVWFFLPETVAWLVQKRPPEALARINGTLAQLGHAPSSSLPPPEAKGRGAGIGQLFVGRLAPLTLLLTLAYFAHIMTFYFILKWAPKIVADLGFPPSAAGGVLVWANIGGMAGSLVLSLLTQRFGVRGLTIGAMVLSTGLVALFGRVGADLDTLTITAIVAGFCTNAGVVGLYAIFAQSFPTAVRASGTGFVIGVGRGGAALSPIVAGAMFSAGAGLPTVALAMGIGSLIAAVALLALRYEDGR